MGSGPGAHSADARLRTMRDFLGHQDGEVITVRHVLALGAGGEVGIEAPHGGQMQPSQERVEIDGRRGRHALTSTVVVASCVRTYSAPMAPCCTLSFAKTPSGVK